MADRDAYREQPGEDEMLRSAVSRIADHLESSSPRIVNAILEASRLEVPEYAQLSNEGRERQRARNLWGIQMMASLIRNARGSFDANERAFLLAAGAEVANEPEPLHAVIRTFQIAAREVLDTVIEIVPELGPAGGPAVSVAFRTGSSLLSVLIEAVEVGFANQTRDAERRSSDQSQSLVADLVLGIAPETYAQRALFAGLGQGTWYRAVVAASSGSDHLAALSERGEDRLVEAIPEGSIYGRLGHVSIVIAPGGDASDPAYRIADLLDSELLERKGNQVNVAIGSPRLALADVHGSFEEALAVVEAARMFGMTGRPSTAQMIVPRLVSSAHAAGIDIAEIVQPLLAASESERLIETVRAYVTAGCSVQKAAESLYMHRNTMRRHIQKAEELLGFPISSRWPEIELALVAISLANTKALQHR